MKGCNLLTGRLQPSFAMKASVMHVIICCDKEMVTPEYRYAFSIIACHLTSVYSDWLRAERDLQAEAK